MRILRWITFVPAAFLSAWLVYAATVLLNRLSISMAGADPDGFLNKVLVTCVSYAVMGAAFVYVGSRIAPGNRKVVAFSLTLVGVLIAGAATFASAVQRDLWSVAGSICMALGSGAVAYSVAEGELDLDTHRLN